MILNKWVRIFNNGDVKDIIGLYTNESSLISTFDSIIINNLSDIECYFHNLINKKTKASIITTNVVKIENNYLEFGIYEFINDDKIIKARFSMLSNGDTIIHHHSSMCNEV